ncbi:MAG TPA: hypothetical protein PK821_08420, partial [Victivallales bacterium]|nr:hypothetical protein [Victivallales bacterium]
LDRLVEGNIYSPPSINDHVVNVRLKSGRNILVFLFMNGKAEAIIAIGGPDDLRRGDFKSIVPPKKKVTDAKSLYELYPTDPEAPIRWVVPENFNPTLPDLGIQHLEGIEHFEIFHAIPSKAAIEDGGDGKYESLRHGTWNHGPPVLIPFKNHVVAYWCNHALDEEGAGSRILGKYGRILDDEGNVDWGGDENLFEAGPAAVPVSRRRIESGTEKVNCIQTRGAFNIIEGRLFFCGKLLALHGKSSNSSSYWEGAIKFGQKIPSDSFRAGPDALALGGQNLRWELGVDFYQEWDIVDGKLKTISPLYRSGEIPKTIAMTPDLTMPVEPFTEAFQNAVPFDEAPCEIRRLIKEGKRASHGRPLKYPPGKSNLTVDGSNGLAHQTQFRRPDGSWVAIRENQKPTLQPVYFAAEKPDEESFYPPARRTNLYGAVNPHAGELPDGTVYIVCNSPNRRTMFITLSKDGRVFDKTYFLMHKMLSDYTPGIMKREGGPGAGPQYFHATVVGKSLWIVYSISKEHIGITRIPLSKLEHDF